jgi:hypothetical protein
MTSPVASVTELARETGFDIIDCLELPGRSNDLRRVPPVLADPVRQMIDRRFAGGGCVPLLVDFGVAPELSVDWNLDQPITTPSWFRV